MTCIITGCALVTTWDGAWAWGDLHELAGCYVFNAAVIPSRTEPVWHHYADAKDNVGQKQLRILSGDASIYFERRGVFVIPKMNAELNEAAAASVEAGRRS